MKKIALFLAVILCFSIAGCNKADNSKKETQEAKTSINLNEDKKDESNSDAVFESDITHVFDNWGKIAIKSYKIVEGRLGETNIVFTLDYTNLYKKETTFSGSVQSSIALFQNGEQLKRTITEEDLNKDTLVQIGETVEVVTAYELLDETTNVEMFCTYLDTPKKTYNLKIEK